MEMPLDAELNEIHGKTFSYANEQDTLYTYISNINSFNQKDEQSDENNDDSPPSGKGDASRPNASPNKTNQKKKKSSFLFIILFLILLCLTLVAIGSFVFYRKSRSKTLSKEGSDSSLESETSGASNSETILVKPTSNTSQFRSRMLFKVDDEL